MNKLQNIFGTILVMH